jgi:hypothetical protein
LIIIVQPVDAYIVLFEEDFQRANNNDVGNGWVEYEPTTAKSAEAQVYQQQLFLSSKSASLEPCVTHTFANVTESYLDWSFVYNFEYRNDNDLAYNFDFELGDSLNCGNPQNGTSVIKIHQESIKDNSNVTSKLFLQDVNQDVKINGTTNIRVLADNSTGTLDLYLSEDNLFEGNSTLTGTYDNTIDINSIRIYTNKMLGGSWAHKNVDDISIRTSDMEFCGITINETLDFGTVKPGKVSGGQILSITGVRTVPTIVSILVSDWIEQIGGTDSIIDGEFTRYSNSSGNYASKDALSTITPIEIGTIDAQSFLELFLQVDVEINDDSYAGDIKQILTFTGTDCEI